MAGDTSSVPERFRSTSAPDGFAGLPYARQPQGIDPAFFAPVTYAPVKCPDCGTWWRTATHRCAPTVLTSGANS